MCIVTATVVVQPGMAVQVNKMGRLVEDLRRQESGYLSILVKLLVSRPTPSLGDIHAPVHRQWSIVLPV